MKNLFIISILVLLVKPFAAQDLTPQDIYQKVSPSILVIKAYDADSNIMSWGSAVSVGDSGLIYTNLHIYSGAKYFELVNDVEDLSDASVAGFIPEKDVLILRIQPGRIKGVSVCRTDIVPGEHVYTIGNPFGLQKTIAEGLLTGMRSRESDKLQYSASISSGSSGGALVNSRGELIGITCSSYKEGQNLNFAVPVKEYADACMINFNDTSEIRFMKELIDAYNYQPQMEKGELITKAQLYAGMKNYSKGSILTASRVCLSYNCYDEAVNLCNSGLEKFGYCQEFHFIKAEAYTKNDSKDSALAELNRILVSDPDNILALYKRYQLYESAFCNYKSAINDLHKLINLRPGLGYFYMNAAQLYMKLNDTINVIKSLKLAGYNNSPDAYSYYICGELYYKLKKYEDAISMYNEAIWLNKDNPGFIMSRGVAYSQLDRDDLAYHDYQTVISFTPAYTSAWNKLAYACFTLKLYEEAEQNFIKTLKLDYTLFDAWLGLSITYFAEGKLKRSIDCMSKAMKIRRIISQGSAGIQKLKDSGYFWTKKEESYFHKIFLKMGLDNEIEETEIEEPRSAHKVSPKIGS